MARESIREAARLIGSLPPDQAEIALAELTQDELADIVCTWQLYARDSQLRPADCRPIWFRQCGRGEGKTRSASEERLDRMEDWGPDYRGILINKTLGDGILTNVEGESGLQACARRRGYELKFHGKYYHVTHPSGGRIQLCTPERPDGPRGFQANDFHAEEISSWGPKAIETWNNLLYAWRLPAPAGYRKTGTVTSTPKPNAITFLLLRDKQYREMVTVTRGRGRDNLANLSDDMLATLNLFTGTKIGRQEEEGELLDTTYAAIDQDTIHNFRVAAAPALERIVVSVDPSINDGPTADDAGLAVMGVRERHAYLLHSQAVASHREWPRRAVELFLAYNCDCVVLEINQGGQVMADLIAVAAQQVSQELGREVVVPVRPVWSHTSKAARAEPVGALYERGRIHHVDHHPAAEKELTSWVPGMQSPNILDAIVQGVSHLLLSDQNNVGGIAGYL